MAKESDFELLKEYVRNWHTIDGIKPSNETVFMVEFVRLLKEYPDEREVEFQVKVHILANKLH